MLKRAPILSSERARQIETRAMQKLRCPTQSRQLLAYALCVCGLGIISFHWE